MWIMTQHGFYSIVRKNIYEFHVRARERQDLQNLINKVPLKGVSISESETEDYRFRLIVNHKTVMSILAFLGEQ